MMIKKLILSVSLTTAALVFSGCDGGSAQMGPKEANLLGIIKHENASYSPTSLSSITESTDEYYTRKNFQGSKTTFLWGLFTLKDY